MMTKRPASGKYFMLAQGRNAELLFSLSVMSSEYSMTYSSMLCTTTLCAEAVWMQKVVNSSQSAPPSPL